MSAAAINDAPRGDITKLLVQLRDGPLETEGKLVALVYDELHRLATRYMCKERPGHSLQSTALVHEAYLRLVSQRATPWKNRAHFFAIAALLMRQILVDNARRRDAIKRGVGVRLVSLDDLDAHIREPVKLDPMQSADLIALDDALTDLTATKPRRSRIAELHLFGGMTLKEIAQALDISERTVYREWAAAQAWLVERLRPLT
jgi:RNA polymerase sigma factor (TIGR02999 family)